MANPNDNSLSRAWTQYWDILFPELASWKKQLQSCIVANAIDFKPNDPLHMPDSLPRKRPSWVSSLSIEVNAAGARVSLKSGEARQLTWLSNFRPEYEPQWHKDHAEHYHPFEALTKYEVGGIDYQHYEEKCFKLLRSITVRIGDMIQHEISFKIRIGHIDAHGHGVDTRTPVSGPEIVKLMNAGHRLNMIDHVLVDRNGATSVEHLVLSKGPRFVDPKQMPSSFAEYDVALFELMLASIKKNHEDGKRLSVNKAASEVVYLALNKGDIGSVQQRLQRGYSQWQKTKLKKQENQSM